MKKSRGEDHPTDRLSELPDSLLLEILSLLKTKDAVRTTILSKRWVDLWTTLPILDFYNYYSYTESFIESALAKWNGAKIKKFLINFPHDNHPSGALDSQLLIPIHNHVEDLFIKFGSRTDPQYFPPQRLYSCSSLTKLYLSHCNLKIEQNVNVQWNQLKSLTIEHPSYMSENAISRILSGAPLLEELMFLSVEISESLDIWYSSLKLLKIGRIDWNYLMTVVRANTVLNIWAPNLLSLQISGCVYGTCLLDVPSLTNAILCFKESCDDERKYVFKDKVPPLEMFDQVFRSVGHVETLTISDFTIELLIEMKKNNTALQFSNTTKFLKLYGATAKAVLNVLGMFPEVKSLIVQVDKDQLYELDIDPAHKDMLEACKSSASEMSFPSPSLLQVHTVTIFWPIYHVSIIPMTEVLLKNTPMLKKMVIDLVMDGVDRRTFELARKKVRSMPRASPTARVTMREFW